MTVSEISRRDEVAQEVNSKLEELSQLQQAIDHLETGMKQEIDNIVKRYATTIDPIKQQKQAAINDLVGNLSMHRQLLTQGEKKSLTFRNGGVSWRLPPESLVTDIPDKLLIKLIRRLRGASRFIAKQESIKKSALKEDRTFVDELVRRRAVHFEQDEILTIKLPGIKMDVLSGDNPYKTRLSEPE